MLGHWFCGLISITFNIKLYSMKYWRNRPCNCFPQHARLSTDCSTLQLIHLIAYKNTSGTEIYSYIVYSKIFVNGVHFTLVYEFGDYTVIFIYSVYSIIAVVLISTAGCDPTWGR